MIKAHKQIHKHADQKQENIREKDSSHTILIFV